MLSLQTGESTLLSWALLCLVLLRLPGASVPSENIGTKCQSPADSSPVASQWTTLPFSIMWESHADDTILFTPSWSKQIIEHEKQQATKQ